MGESESIFFCKSFFKVIRHVSNDSIIAHYVIWTQYQILRFKENDFKTLFSLMHCLTLEIILNLKYRYIYSSWIHTVVIE
jgi:predicted SprT family Zn-dependent metalloprotease